MRARRRVSTMSLGLALVTSALAFALGCVDDIVAPACTTIEDCDRSAGYTFCHRGFCFKRPAPEGTLSDGGALSDAPDGSPDLVGETSSRDVETSCPPETPVRSGDGCCPVHLGGALGGDDDCVRWRAPLHVTSTAWFAEVDDPGGAPISVVTALRKASEGQDVGIVTAAISPDGRLRWEKELGRARSLVAPVGRPDGRVLVVSDGRLAALDTTDGEVVARVDLDTRVTPLEVGDDLLLVARADGAVSLFDGELVEKRALMAPARPITLASPACGSDGTAYVLDDEGRLTAFTAGGQGAAGGQAESQRWSLALDGTPVPHALAVWDARVGDGQEPGNRIAALLAPDVLVVVSDGGDHGTVLGRVALGAAPAPGVVVDEGARVLVATARPELIAFGEVEDALEERWRTSLPIAASGVAPLRLADGTVVLGGDDGVAAVRPPGEDAPLEVVWTLDRGRGVAGSVAHHGDTLAACESDGTVVGYAVSPAPLADVPWPSWRKTSSNSGAPQ